MLRIVFLNKTQAFVEVKFVVHGFLFDAPTVSLSVKRAIQVFWSVFRVTNKRVWWVSVAIHSEDNVLSCNYGVAIAEKCRLRRCQEAFFPLSVFCREFSERFLLVTIYQRR